MSPELAPFKKCDYYLELSDESKKDFEQIYNKEGMPSNHDALVAQSPEERKASIDKLNRAADKLPDALKDLPLPKIVSSPDSAKPEERVVTAPTEQAPSKFAQLLQQSEAPVAVDTIGDARARLEAHFLFDEPEPQIPGEVPRQQSVLEVAPVAEPVLPPDVVLDAKRIVNEQTTPEPVAEAEVISQHTVDRYVAPEPTPDTRVSYTETAEPEPIPMPATEKHVAFEPESVRVEEVQAVTESLLPDVRTAPIIETASIEEAQTVAQPAESVEPVATEAATEPEEQPAVFVVSEASEVTEDIQLFEEATTEQESSEETDQLYDEMSLPAPVFEGYDESNEMIDFSMAESEDEFPDIPLTAEELLAAIDNAKEAQFVALHDEAAPIAEGEMIEVYDRTKEPEQSQVLSAQEAHNDAPSNDLLAKVLPVDIQERIQQHQTEVEPDEAKATQTLINFIESAATELVELEKAEDADIAAIQRTEDTIVATYNRLLEEVGIKSLPEREQLVETLIASIKVQAVQVEDDEGTHEFKRALNAAFTQQSAGLHSLSTQLGKLIVAAIRGSSHVLSQ